MTVQNAAIILENPTNLNTEDNSILLTDTLNSNLKANKISLTEIQAAIMTGTE